MEILEKILSVLGKILLGIWKFYKWVFITSYKLNMLLFGLIGLLLGVSSSPPPPPPPRPLPDNEDNEDISKNLPGSTTDKVVKKYGKNLENYVESKSKTSIEARIIEKIRNSPGKLIEEILSQEEMEILFEMILKAYGLI